MHNIKKVYGVFKHKISVIQLPIPLPVKKSFLIGPRLGIVKKQVFEPEVSEFLTSRANSNTIFADVGAGYGYHSILMAKYLSKFGSKVYSFEPSPKDFRYLKINTLINRLKKKMILMPFFVTNISGHLQEFNTKNHSSYLEGNGKIIKVRTVTLDSLQVNFNLVKIDAEGADLSVLLGSERLIHQGCEFCIEIGEKFSTIPIEDVLNKIRSLGLVLYELPHAIKVLSNSEIKLMLKQFKHINVAAIPVRINPNQLFA